MVIYFAQPQRFAGNIRFVAHHGNRQIFRQTGDKIWPDIRRIGRTGGGAVDHEQYAVGLFNLLPGTLDADALDLVVRIAQAGGINDVQRHTVNVDMLAQNVAGGSGNIGDDSRFPARQRVQQA